MRSAFLISAFILLSGAAAFADTNQSEIDRRLHEFSDSIMSPYCPGMTLSGCPSPDARALRDEVRGRLEHGETEAVIRQDLVARFGPELSGLPDSKSSSEAAFGVPFFLISTGLLGVLAMIGYGRRVRTSGAVDVEGFDQASAETKREIYREIDDELKRRLEAQG